MFGFSNDQATNFNILNFQDNNYIHNNIQSEIPLIKNSIHFFEDKKLLDLHESINIFNKDNSTDDDNLLNEGNDKFLSFFKSHNFTNEKAIIKMDEKINEDKKFFFKLTNSLEDDMKCCICLNAFKDPLLCPYCHHFFCRICINKWFDENKNNCVYCRKNLDKDSFIEISIFRTVLPFLDLLKENNNRYFDYKIKNNIEKVTILCSNPIHEKNDEENKPNNINFKENDIVDNEKNKENKYDDNLDKIKADYYCFDCNKPFCSDCICINDDYSNCGHKDDHLVFNIETLNDMKLFDLLYEKENNNTIEKLKKMNEELTNGINELNKRKNNTLLFIEYIKNTYIEFVNNKINELKDMIKKNEEEIKKVKNKFNDLDNFIKNLKNEENIKNSKNCEEIQDTLNLINDFDKLPEKTQKDLNDTLKFTGKIQLKEHMNSTIEIDTISFDTSIYRLDSNFSFIIINENFKKKKFNNNPFLYYENEDNKDINKNNDSKNIKLKLVLKMEIDQFHNFGRQKENEKNIFFCPILFNNENKFIEFNEIIDKNEIYLIELRETKGFIDLDKNIQNSFKYFKSNIELDNFLVNDNKNNKKIKYSNSKNISICLYSLTIK